MSPSEPSLTLTLRVRPATAQDPWQATLEGPGPRERRVFSNPVDLALHLEALGRPPTPSGRAGLR